MKSSPSINTTFKAIGQLPLEVSIEQVRQWVAEAPDLSIQKVSWWQAFKNKLSDLF